LATWGEGGLIAWRHPHNLGRTAQGCIDQSSNGSFSAFSSCPALFWRKPSPAAAA